MGDTKVEPRVGFPSRPRLTHRLAALGYRNYRLWFVGQLTSLVGSWMETTAQGFLIFQLTGSPAYLGLVGFAAGIPSWLFMLFGGVIADRIPRRTLLVITQSAMMTASFVLALLTFTRLVQPWHIVLLALWVGTANAFDAPARQSFVLEMVTREHLPNAIALNSTMFQMATVVGPAAAGLTYAAVGPAWCFTINGLSYIAVIVALLMMKIDVQPIKQRTKSAVEDLKEGLQYTLTHPIVRAIILIAGVVSLFGFSFVTLLPAWAVDVLGGDAATNGLLQSARGVGALLGALLIISLGNFRFKGRLLTVGSFLFPISLLVFSFVRPIPLSLLVLVVTGLGFMVMFNMLNTILQTIISDELRGRVMSIYTLTFFGGMPLGALWAGAVAEHFGEPLTVMVGATVTLLFAVFVYWRLPQMRHIR